MEAEVVETEELVAVEVVLAVKEDPVVEIADLVVEIVAVAEETEDQAVEIADLVVEDVMEVTVEEINN